MEKFKKKALIIAYNDLNNSGVPNVIYNTIKSLNNDYVFFFLVFNDDLYYYKKLEDENITVEIIHWQTVMPKSMIRKILYYLLASNKLYHRALKLLKFKNYDVIHSFKEYESWPFLKAAKELSIQKRIFHSNVNHSIKQNLFGTLITKFSRMKTLKYANVFVGVTNQCAKYAFGNKNFDVVYNTYDEVRFNRNIYRIITPHLVLTQIGSFSSNKNQLFTIDVCKILNTMGVRCDLHLIGKELESGYLNKTISRIKEANLSDCIFVSMGDEYLAKALRTTTFTIVPSFFEGASIVAIESQACGIPCFASTAVSKELDCGGLFQFDLKDGPESCAKTILKNYQNKVQETLKYHMERFSNAEFKKKISEIYKR